MAILETEALTRRFGKVTAVDTLNISIEAGEIFGLLGPNGAGKTTVIKMLTTLLPPTSGDARVGGFDITRHPADVRRIIGYVPQMLSADGTLTGYENLLVFASNAIYPISIMPTWLQVISHINPLTYEVDALRALMIVGGASAYGIGFDVGILLVATTLLIMLAARLYPSVVV
jgi:ABC-type branched-subunit amino acid transport system ATPase component